MLAAAHPTEIEHFLSLMRKHGEGSVAVAWRRYFDLDGDGELTFTEFCKALISLEFKDDALKLWHLLDFTGKRRLALDDFDPKGADLIVSFGRWCKEFGGISAVFKAVDALQCSIDPIYQGRLTRKALLAGLDHIGLFNGEDHKPEGMKSARDFSQLMWPILDIWGKGIVTEECFVFLEADPDEKKLRKKKKKVPKGGAALNLLNSLSKQSRIGQDMDQFGPTPEEFEALARNPPKPCEKTKRPKVHRSHVTKRSASTPELTQLSNVVPPAGQAAAEAAAAVLEEVASAQALKSSCSLPRLPGAVASGGQTRLPNYSVASSRRGGDVASSDAGFSVAASSVAATRQGMRRLYKVKLEDRLPALTRKPVQAVTGAAGNQRRQVDSVMNTTNPKHSEDFFSQKYEKVVYQRYYCQ